MTVANSDPIHIYAPTTAVVVDCSVAQGTRVRRGQALATLESMKMQLPVLAPADGVLARWALQPGTTVTADAVIGSIVPDASEHSRRTPRSKPDTASPPAETTGDALWRERLADTTDAVRTEQAQRRHEHGYRTARENLDDLVDAGSFREYGQLAVAAQRNRRPTDELRRDTAADGVITGCARINGEQVGKAAAQAIVVINDYSVLAGTQGYFHHRKLDRALELARAQRLPVVMYTEGGGGRPGDTDVTTQIAGLDLSTFALWAGLRGAVPRIAVNNGYCFAGNAALFGGADITIATRSSWIGMAGPAMIEGGGLGRVAATDIGPIAVQSTNGVVDIVAQDEADATRLARQALGYFQGPVRKWQVEDQSTLGAHMPADRRYAYDMHALLAQLCDTGSVLCLRAAFGRAVICALARIEGRPVGVIASDCRHLGGAIDAEAADKAADFIALCGRFGLPIVSLVDTPGFMVGPDSERQAAARRMARLFAEGAQAPVPWVCVFVRRGYGLGAMALAGGSFRRPVFSAAWPSGEFGGMGLEGAVRLGYRRELEAIEDAVARRKRFDALLAEAYARGRAVEMAAMLEIDAVIAPEDTRAALVSALASAAPAVPTPAGDRAQ